MNSQKIVKIALVVGLGIAALPAFAQTVTTNAKVNVSGVASATVSAKVQSRGDTEISNRITALNTLATRVGAMQKLSASEKTNLSTQIQTEISTMTNLKAKIDADTDAATLKADTKSITDSYRIYALILPQGSLLAASDRVQTIASMMTTIGTKFQTRISADQSAGKNVTSLQAALTDYTAKIADANTQANASVTLTASLTPDNGNATMAASNKTALTTARNDIKTATSDLKTARADATTIFNGLKALEVKGSATTTVQ